MESLAILKELGAWGVAVLVGSMGFTEVVKRASKRAGAETPWWAWIVMPSVLAGIGTVGLGVGGLIEWRMALLVWFVVSFTGPILYSAAIKPGLKKIKG